MKITQPPARCVECYARELETDQNLPTSARFNPDPTSKENIEVECANVRDSEDSERSSANSEAAAEIAKW